MADEQPKENPAAQGGKDSHLKISKMNLDQVSKALDHAKKTMGGTHSQYAQALLAQEAVLRQNPSTKKK